MVYSIGVPNQKANDVSFGKKSKAPKHDELMYNQRKHHPIATNIGIQADKLTKAFTKYPIKGFKGSKNANFYEFLTMGTVPYLAGSAALIAVFNLAAMFYNPADRAAALTAGKKMGLGVIFYGIAKSLSKKLVETPLNMKYGIDMNLPVKKVVNELPEKGHKKNLVSYEYHKVFESVDFPRWDLIYNNKCYGDERDSYFKKVGKKMGFKDEELKYADQKVKPLIKEKVVKAKLFSTLSSYLWAGVGVGVAMQKPWDYLHFERLYKLTRNIMSCFSEVKNCIKSKDIKKIKDIVKVKEIYNELVEKYKEYGVKKGKGLLLEPPVNKSFKTFVKDFASTFVNSAKEFVGADKMTLKDYITKCYKQKPTKSQIAGRALLFAAVGMTLLGNFSTLFDFNKYKGQKTHAAASLIDESKEKVVC